MKKEPSEYFVGHTRSDRWLSAALCLLVAPFFFLPFYVGWGPWKVMLFYYLGMGFALSIPLRLFLKTFENLYLYQEGIEIHKLFQQPQFLFWDEITQIRGSVWSSDLIISNGRGNVSCRVNSSYTNTDVLLHLLLYARPDLFHTEQHLKFTQSPIPIMLLAVLFVQLSLVIIVGESAGSYGSTLLILLGFVLVILLGVLMVIPYSLSILGNLLVFRYPFRKSVIQAADVAYIAKTTRFDFIYEWGEVAVHEKNGNVTLLMFYNLGVSLLYAFLAYWHQMVVRSRLEAGDVMESAPEGGHQRLSKNAPYLLPAKNIRKGNPIK